MNELRENVDSLQKIKEKISHVEDQSLESTRRMRELISETKQTGIKTAEVY